ncbi:MAG TPA: hypothetical protein EYH15_01855 [Methanothermococcus okinawensis]|uniref:Probable [NiFe]-hydrogenase-type-3 Eha complex membrane subunit A n=1 Tax=Methanothermococcus okinawensis TaxID=155863 RepID=A0A832Z7A0_9EURY|nr:hypothetical protein [Methanococcaceae archaeon]HIP84222.1 hypothetical protein [Methanothermococcus okinawensis]HIP91020.1 hypothetical protein [Methanothermococcus okinawensis]
MVGGNVLYLYYILSVVISLVVGFIIGLPVEIDVNSFKGNLFFPTVFVALGLTAVIDILFNLNLVFTLLVGIFSPLFSKYVDLIFPGVSYGG